MSPPMPRAEVTALKEELRIVKAERNKLRQELRRIRTRKRLAHRTWEERNQKECPKCGGPMNWRSKTCRACARPGFLSRREEVLDAKG
jgi:predicted RNA-binding Zn-ribbon protein involved in translation (DUF1610 family)